LEAKTISFPTNDGNNESTGSGLVHITPYKAAPSLLQLETRPRSRGDGRLHAELGNTSGVRQSPMVPDTLLSHESEEASSKDSSTDNTPVENPTMVSTSTGTSGGLPLENSLTTGSSINATGTRISNATGNAPVGRLAYLRQSYTSRGIS